MHFVDTNIFLRYFTGDDPAKADRVLCLLKKVEANEEKVFTSPLVVFETIFTLSSFYQVPRSRIAEIMLPLLQLRGLHLENKAVFESALELYASSTISFADLFNVCYMRAMKVCSIYSYDKDFDGFGDIERKEP